MKHVLDFLNRLASNNYREWFNAHKDEYLAAKATVDALTDRLIGQLSAIDPDAARLRVADCTYRIYRDTRFSADKTPYKTHIGIFINPPFGKKSMRLGHYLHLEPYKSMFAAGTIALPSPVVKALRRSIYDEIDEYRSIVEDPAFRALYPELGMNPVKTAPQGFRRDWEFIDYVRPRDFIAWAPLVDDFITSPGLAERLQPYMEQAHRFNRFFNYTIEDFE